MKYSSCNRAFQSVFLSTGSTSPGKLEAPTIIIDPRQCLCARSRTSPHPFAPCYWMPRSAPLHSISIRFRFRSLDLWFRLWLSNIPLACYIFPHRQLTTCSTMHCINCRTFWTTWVSGRSTWWSARWRSRWRERWSSTSLSRDVSCFRERSPSCALWRATSRTRSSLSRPPFPSALDTCNSTSLTSFNHSSSSSTGSMKQTNSNWFKLAKIRGTFLFIHVFAKAHIPSRIHAFTMYQIKITIKTKLNNYCYLFLPSTIYT